MKPMKPIKKAVVTMGKYTDRNGMEKNRYATIGTLLQRDDGSLSLKLDTLPVGGWEGWINFYDLDENRQQNNQQGMQQAKDMGAMDIPF